MSDATCTLELMLSFELIDEVDRAACDRIRARALSLLHDHGLGPDRWDVPDLEQRWPFGPQLHEGVWWQRPIRARVIFTARRFRIALSWEVPLPNDLCEPVVRYVRALQAALPPGARISGLTSLVPSGVLHRSPPPSPRSGGPSDRCSTSSIRRRAPSTRRDGRSIRHKVTSATFRHPDGARSTAPHTSCTGPSIPSPPRRSSARSWRRRTG